MPSSLNKYIILAAFLALAACKSPAPELPSGQYDEGSNPYIGDSCTKLKAQKEDVMRQRNDALSRINGDRSYNQQVGFAGVLFLPLWLATEGHSYEKSLIASLQPKWDMLIAAERHNGCS